MVGEGERRLERERDGWRGREKVGEGERRLEREGRKRGTGRGSGGWTARGSLERGGEGRERGERER